MINLSTKSGLKLKNPPSFFDSFLFYTALKSDKNSFLMYSGVPYSKKNVSYFKNYFKSFQCVFSIYKNRRFAGYVALSPRNSEYKEFTIEFYVLHQYRRQGIAYNSVGAVIQFAMNFFTDIEEIHAVLIKENVAVHKLLNKLGFEQSGEQVNLLMVDGTLYNPVCTKFKLEL